MITEALQHFRGIGPVWLARLQEMGIRSWHDVLSMPDSVPSSLRLKMLEDCQRSLAALEQNDIQFFIENLSSQDQWRILTQYLDQASFFDIETTGLEYDDTITVIVCWHRDQLFTFVEHENLDDFLDLLDDVSLLVSFNGSTFDVPRVLDGFHIPALPCAHLDLRWPCHYRNLVGGLKQVSAKIGVQRPPDLAHADGDLAVRLWSQWRNHGDDIARQQLIRYCTADVLLLRPVSEFIAGRTLSDVHQLWNLLPAAPALPVAAPADQRQRVLMSHMFGHASPGQLRTRRRK